MRNFKNGIGFLVNRAPLILESIHKKRLDEQLSCGLGTDVHVCHL